MVTAIIRDVNRDKYIRGKKNKNQPEKNRLEDDHYISTFYGRTTSENRRTRRFCTDGGAAKANDLVMGFSNRLACNSLAIIKY